MTGQEIYQTLSKHYAPKGTPLHRDYDPSMYSGEDARSGPAVAADVLHQAGIPGVKFQDAGSRGLPPGHPNETHNYVIFHHQNLKVIDKNGQHFGLEPAEGDPWVAPKPRTQP